MANNKTEILKILSVSLAAFRPDLQNHFMCPVCLTAIPIHEKSKISEAHIIPKAAKGNLKTYLCIKCNSLLGTKQDKWFGEFIKIIKKESNIITSNIKDGHFYLDDIRVNGNWNEDAAGNINFYYHVNKNSPQTFDLIKKKFKTRPSALNLKFTSPVLREKEKIKIGFLTAAYLLWFKAFGYSWVFQKHLDAVRQQILNPDKEIIVPKYFGHCADLSYKPGQEYRPWIGVLPMSGHLVPAMGLEKFIAFFPPADKPDIYSILNEAAYNFKFTELRKIDFSGNATYGPPISIIFNDRLLMLPDYSINALTEGIVLNFTKDNSNAIVMTPVTKEEADKIEQTPGTIIKKYDFRTHGVKEEVALRHRKGEVSHARDICQSTRRNKHHHILRGACRNSLNRRIPG